MIKGTSDRRVSDVLQINPKERNVAEGRTKMAEVLNVVRNRGGQVTAKEVALWLDIPQDLAGKYLRRLSKVALLKKLSRGVFEYRDD